MGPVCIDDQLRPSINPKSWSQKASVLLIDNPLGTGFSFVENELGYDRDEVAIGTHGADAVVQFMRKFELLGVPLYMSGISYGGKMVSCFCAFGRLTMVCVITGICLRGLRMRIISLIKRCQASWSDNGQPVVRRLRTSAPLR